MSENVTSARAGAAEASGGVPSGPDVGDDDREAAKRAAAVEYQRRVLDAAEVGVVNAWAKAERLREQADDAAGAARDMERQRDVAADELAAAERAAGEG